MSIAHKLRADYFAHIHTLQKKLATIARADLSDAEQLNEDILAFELNSSTDLENFPENLLPISQMDNVPSTLANYASGYRVSALNDAATVPGLLAASAARNAI